MKRAILERASRRVILADATKWPVASTVEPASWSEINDLVLDKTLPPKDADGLRQHGTMVHLAET